MTKLDPQVERIELLSSPLILDESTKDEDDQVDDDPIDEIKTRTFRSQSPLRFRERLAGLFGSGGGKSTVDEQLKSIADAEDQQLNMDPIGEEQETIKSTETRGSSLINEQQTYYNTIRNQYISDVEPLSDPNIENKVPINDVPPSRLFLSIYPDQVDYFKRDKDMTLDKIKNYDLMYKWNLWSDKNTSNVSRPGTSASNVTFLDNDQAKTSEKRRLKKEFPICSKIKLNETILQYKKSFKQSNETFHIHIFKDGIKPKRNIKEFENGGILAMQSSDCHYTHWKSLLRIFLDDKFDGEEYPDVYALKDKVCGLSFIMKEQHILLTKLWLKDVDKEKVSQLCRLISENIHEPLLLHALDNAKFMNNKSQTIEKVFF